ncbi:hypothetical protein MRB53_034663 [Persea americana]|uniref:Uncharacterized protein n=1 Tax=Persea americana TaxID=3435 RepID=A0ACC2K2J3_PERAE|nr:hypothetical protein MRB53_034663 [Persea americana]
MSNNPKVVVFGSFTEDEARLFQQQSKKDVSEQNELQFGSLDFATVRSLGAFKVQCKQNGSPHWSEDDQPSKLVTIEEKLKNETDDVLKRISGNAKSNGTPEDQSSCCFPLSNGVSNHEETNIELSSLCLSQNKTGNGMPLRSPKDSFEYRRSADENVVAASKNSIQNESHIGSSTVVASKDDFPTTFTEQGTAAETLPAKNLLPRGLINLGNLCFLNATLQALLSCPPFAQLLQKLRTRNIPKVGYPTLRAFVEFISDVDMPNDLCLKKTEMVLETGRPFSPIMFEPVLKNFTPDLPTSMSGRPRQEDAQEFLSFVMDQMHDELLKLNGCLLNLNGNASSLISSPEDDDWETVGPKNKSAVTRTQTFKPSELSDIFGGQLRSVVKARGKKASATVQPFLLLHLDIFSEAVHTIEDALRLFSAPEALEGYRTSAGKAGVVSASKSVKIQMLSKILIMHLMRFSYGSKGSTKLHKPVRFPLELCLGRDLLVSPSSEGRRYELVATITHHGREPSKGHYTADARYSDGQWLRYDDASVTAVGTGKVLHDQAYVLFYRQL